MKEVFEAIHEYPFEALCFAMWVGILVGLISDGISKINRKY